MKKVEFHEILIMDKSLEATLPDHKMYEQKYGKDLNPTSAIFRIKNCQKWLHWLAESKILNQFLDVDYKKKCKYFFFIMKKKFVISYKFFCIYFYYQKKLIKL